MSPVCRSPPTKRRWSTCCWRKSAACLGWNTRRRRKRQRLTRLRQLHWNESVSPSALKIKSQQRLTSVLQARNLSTNEVLNVRLLNELHLCSARSRCQRSSASTPLPHSSLSLLFSITLPHCLSPLLLFITPPTDLSSSSSLLFFTASRPHPFLHHSSLSLLLFITCF